MSKLILYDFECPQGHTFESLVPPGQLESECPVCDKQAKRLVSIPTVKLEGYSGDFPTAYDRWAKVHKEGTKQAYLKKHGFCPF